MLDALGHPIKIGKRLRIPEKQIAISVFLVFCNFKFCLRNVNIIQEVTFGSVLLNHCCFLWESIGKPVKEGCLIVPYFCKTLVLVSNMVNILLLLGIVLANDDGIFI